MTDTLGQRIANRRKMLSMSQEALGERMGVSRQAISKWESDAAIPEVDRLIEMSKLFDVSIGWLLGTEQIDEEALEASFLPIVPLAPSPQTPSEPENRPAPEQPSRQPLAWLSVLCGVVAVASLILAAMAYFREPEIPTAQLSREDSEYIDTVMQDMEYLRQRNEALNEGLIERRAACDSTQKQLDALQAYVYSMEAASGLASELAEYEQFISWNLVGDISSSLDKVKLAFSCQPQFNIGVTDVWLYIFQGDTTVEYYSCVYYEEKSLYYYDFTLPVDDGYRYEVKLVYDTGKTEQLQLAGHGLSDLKAAAQPQIQSAQASSHSSHSAGGVISVSYDDITLKVPPLFPSTYDLQFVELRLVHYHNGEAVAEHDLTEMIKPMNRSAPTLSFSLWSQDFSTVGTKDGDTHEIRLEGNLKITADTSGMIDPIYNDYSIVLQTWENTDGQLHLAQ